VTEFPIALADFSTTRLAAFLAAEAKPVVLWPVGCVEPHGPHLPLATDTIIAAENATRAARALRARGVGAVVAPPLPYGAVAYAQGFAGALSASAEALTGVVTAAVDAFRAQGFQRVCLVNHHLDPAHLAWLAALQGVIVPQVVSRRWGARLGAEFRSGACHAGRYETSLVLAARPELVDVEAARRLPALSLSLSEGIRAGKRTFAECGMAEAYTGDPAAASAAEGEDLYAVLTEMVVTEVCESLGEV
jgi:creatinine amidohydrolase